MILFKRTFYFLAIIAYFDLIFFNVNLCEFFTHAKIYSNETRFHSDYVHVLVI